jgi:hypothetical protein
MDMFGMDSGGVESALSGLGGLMSTITNEIEQPIKAMVQQVLGGIWKGKGADAFVEMINNQVMGGVTKVQGHVGSYQTHINNTVDLINAGDMKAASATSPLDESFNF